MTVLRSVSCATWPIAVGSTTPTAPGPATLPVASPGIDPERAAVAAAAALGVEPDRLFGRDRGAAVVLARQLAMVCAHRGGHSLSDVGRAFGRTHTTVMYAVRVVRDRAARDPAVEQLLDWIIATATDQAASSCAPRLKASQRRRRTGAARARRHSPPPCDGDVDELELEFVGSYADRRVLLAIRGGTRVLIDRRVDGLDERVIDRFETRIGPGQLAAVARDYLEQARRGRVPRLRSVA